MSEQHSPAPDAESSSASEATTATSATAAASAAASAAAAAETLTEATTAATEAATAAADATANAATDGSQEPTPSTVEQAGDAMLLEAAGKLSIEELSRSTFQSIADYVKGELEITIDDYSLLVEMNRVATQKYADMHNVASGVSKSLEDLNEKYRVLQPYLDQVDHLEASVTQLEQAAYRLDAYSKRLEAKFKALEKR